MNRDATPLQQVSLPPSRREGRTSRAGGGGRPSLFLKSAERKGEEQRRKWREEEEDENGSYDVPRMLVPRYQRGKFR